MELPSSLRQLQESPSPEVLSVAGLKPVFLSHLLEVLLGRGFTPLKHSPLSTAVKGSLRGRLGCDIYNAHVHVHWAMHGSHLLAAELL